MDSIAYTRHIQPRIEEALADTPVVLVHGPRQCGKTTLVKQIGDLRGYTYMSFDDDNLVNAAHADPIGFVDRLGDKVILDEIQRVPELFTSLKHAVDKHRVAGRFLLTGSANILLLPKLSDSLAGRMEAIQLHTLSRYEIEAKGEALLPHLFKNELAFRPLDKLNDTLAEYIVEGGFPEPLQRASAKRKQQWYQNYINTLIQRDIREMAQIANLDALPKLLELTALQSAQLLNLSSISKSFQLSRQTITSYFTLLQHIFLVDELPAWHNNKGKRLIKTPKVHLCDTGLAAAVLKLTSEQLYDEDRTILGNLLESFVYNELKRQASWHKKEISFYHYRDKDQYEVDIVMEQYGGGTVGIEVKASATVKEQDFKGLKRLQNTVGKHWKAGIIFFDGEYPLSFGSKLHALPISALWSWRA